MFLTPVELTKKFKLKQPTPDLLELSKLCTLYVRNPSKGNIGLVKVDDSNNFNYLAFVGYLNSVFYNNKTNYLCLILHIEPLLDTVSKLGYYNTINALQSELAEIAKHDCTVFFLVPDATSIQDYPEWRFIKTYLSYKTDIKTIMVVDNEEQSDQFMHCIKKLEFIEVGGSDERVTDS